MSPAKFQTEIHNNTTSTQIHKCGYESETEKLSRRISIRANASPKKNKSATLMKSEADMIASVDEATREADTADHSHAKTK